MCQAKTENSAEYNESFNTWQYIDCKDWSRSILLDIAFKIMHLYMYNHDAQSLFI